MSIAGIGLAIATTLNNEGIHTFEQLAALNKDEIERLEEKTNQPGRGARWRDKAAELAASRGQAVPPPPPMGGVGSQPLGLSGATAPPPDKRDAMIDRLSDQVGKLMAELALAKKASAQTQAQAATTRRERAASGKRSHVNPRASEDRITRLRLNPHRKFSDIVGSDPSLPPGTAYQQMVEENGELRTAYFGADFIQRFSKDEDADEIDLDDVEDEHVATVYDVNFRHYLDGRVDYPPQLVLAAMRERLAFDGKTMKEAKQELNRILRTNRA